MKPLYYEIIENEEIRISGQTYFYKDQLKEQGAVWRSKEKIWILHHTDQNLSNLVSLGAKNLGEKKNQTNQESHPLSQQTFKGQPLITLAHLSAFLSQVIQKATPEAFWIEAEISHLTMSQKGHIYLDLVEPHDPIHTTETPQKITHSHLMSAIIWKQQFQKLKQTYPNFPFEAGLKVRFLVSCDYTSFKGSINLYVQDLDEEFTLGELLLQRAAIVKKLKQKGYYDLNKQKTLNPFPHRIALLTAKGSRAYSDFLDEMKQSHWGFEIFFFAVASQGQDTQTSVQKALSDIAEKKDLDVIVITRGGGSRQDLRWFDDYEIAKSIALAPIPVITAIGHFEDISIADEVAWQAEKTPTAAAHFLTNRLQEDLTNQWNFLKTLSYQIKKQIQNESLNLQKKRDEIFFLIRYQFENQKKWLESLRLTCSTLQNQWDHFFSRGLVTVKKNGKHLTAKKIKELAPQDLIQLSSYDLKDKKEWLIFVEVKQISFQELKHENRKSKRHEKKS